jgi:hypothetical protein
VRQRIFGLCVSGQDRDLRYPALSQEKAKRWGTQRSWLDEGVGLGFVPSHPSRKGSTKDGAPKFSLTLDSKMRQK